MAVFDRGDIVRVRLDPVEGHEMRGDARPALVLTTRTSIGSVMSWWRRSRKAVTSLALRASLFR